MDLGEVISCINSDLPEDLEDRDQQEWSPVSWCSLHFVSSPSPKPRVPGGTLQSFHR